MINIIMTKGAKSEEASDSVAEKITKPVSLRLLDPHADRSGQVDGWNYSPETMSMSFDLSFICSVSTSRINTQAWTTLGFAMR